MLTAQSLYKSYQQGESKIDVLMNINFNVKAGESVAIIGPSGSGKSTLLAILAGLETPDKGKVLYEGKIISEYDDQLQSDFRNKKIGMIFQNFELAEALSALENVMLPADIGGYDKREKAEQLLDSLGLSHRKKHIPSQLSGGEQQRVAIARALINDPDYIFADEPTGNLDAKTGTAIIKTLLSHVRSRPRVLVLITHDADIAAQCDRIIRISEGNLIEEKKI